MKYSQQEILQGVQKNDSRILAFLYQQLRPQIRSYILSNGGSEQDAEDILQDGIIAFYTNVRNGSYSLQANAMITTYVHQICRFRWLDQLKSSRNKTSVRMEEEHTLDYGEEAEYYQSLEKVEVTSKVERMFAQLGEKCKHLLTLYYYEKKKMSEINTIMNFSGNTSKNEKYRCMKKLRTLYAN